MDKGPNAMRIATCIAPLVLQVRGNKSSVAIGEGWHGDLDQVIGIDDNGKPWTIAMSLGHHFTPANFRLEPTDTKKSATTQPHSQE